MYYTHTEELNPSATQCALHEDRGSVCSWYDGALVAAVRQASSRLEEESHSFAYFDLGLEDYEWEILQYLEITHFASLSKPGNFLDSKEEVAHYIQTLSPAGHNNAIATEVASIVTKVVEHIIDASAFPTASVLMVSGLPLDTYDQATRDLYRLDSIYWHVDKTLHEISDTSYQATKSQQTYLFTLKGRSTLYYPSNASFQQQFLANTDDTFLDFGCELMHDCKLEEMLDLSRISTAPRGYGSVHLAGKIFGTIHAAPVPHERLVVIVIPEALEVIEEYNRSNFPQ